jgi:hypothetical protein
MNKEYINKFIIIYIFYIFKLKFYILLMIYIINYINTSIFNYIIKHYVLLIYIIFTYKYFKRFLTNVKHP